MRLRTAAGLGLAIACSLIAAASAGAATQLTSGRLTDAQGRGTVGEVRVYAWPHHTKAMDLPLLGVAHAAADGTFTVVAIDDRRLQRLAAQRDGFLDMTAVADTPGYQGERTWTSFVGPAGGRLHTVPAQSVRAGQARISSLASPAPRINIRAARRLPIRAHSSQQPHCQVKRQVQPTQSPRSSAIVGELNNAYNDGTVGTFLYGREHVAETDVGIVHTFTDVKGAPQVD